MLDIGVDNDIVKKSGAWYTYEGEQLGQGRENAKQFLQENPEIMIEISERIRTKMGLGEHAEEPARRRRGARSRRPADQPRRLILGGRPCFRHLEIRKIRKQG